MIGFRVSTYQEVSRLVVAEPPAFAPLGLWRGKSAKEETVGSQKISPDALSGFVVGEGCFYVESGYDKKYRLGWRIRPAFCVEVRHDDRDVLKALQSAIGCGNVYDLDFGRYKGYEEKKWQPHVKYRVSNFEDIQSKVIPFFRQYPLFGRKRKCFDLFCQIVDAMILKNHLVPDKLEAVKALVREMNILNKKGV